MSKKGHKNVRGIPEKYEELKQRYNMTLTPTAAAGLDAIASSLGLSRSELCEQIGRGLIPLHPYAITEGEKTTMGKSWKVNSSWHKMSWLVGDCSTNVQPQAIARHN